MNDASYLSPPKADVWRISDILQLARRGVLRTPQFQRNFVWGTKDVVKLFDSIYRGYPIGSLLIWKAPANSDVMRAASCRFGPLEFKPAADGQGNIVVDGQQRVTSLVATLLGGAKAQAATANEASFSIGFDLEAGTFEAVANYEAAKARNAWLPLEVVADTISFLEWLQSRKPQFTREQTDRANLVVRAIRDYDVPVYLVEDVDSRAIAEIFVRLNEGGRPLKRREVFAALNRGRKDGLDLAEVNLRLAHLKWGNINEDWLLKALAAVDGHLALKDRDPGPALQAAGDRLVAALERAIEFLQVDALIPRWELMPYHFPLLPLVRLFDQSPALSKENRDHLATWIWRGVASGKHSETTKPTIRAALDAAELPEGAAVFELLISIDRPCPPFSMRDHDFRTAQTKLACIVLLLWEPHHISTGEVLSQEVNLKSGDWRYIWPGHDKRGTENRVFHPAEANLRERLAQASPDIAESHCVSPRAQQLLLSGSVEDFLEVRRVEIVENVNEFLANFKAMD